MIQKPVLQPHYTPAILPSEGVLLLSDRSHHALHGALYEAIVPLLNGKNEPTQIAAELSEKFEATHVYYALLMLEKKGYICESNPTDSTETDSFWSSMGLKIEEVRSALETKSVSIITVGSVDRAPLKSALTRLGIRIMDTDSNASLRIVLADDYLNEDLLTLNTESYGRQPLLVLRPHGSEIWIGPLYGPNSKGCHACLTKYLARNRQVESFAFMKGATPRRVTANASLPASKTLAAEMAAVEIAKFLAGGPIPLENHVLSYDTHSMQLIRHQLIRNPSCKVCGTSVGPNAPEIAVESRRVTFMQDGGHRSVSPEATVRRYEHLVSPITGVVTELLPIKQAEGITHVYLAGQNAMYGMENLNFLKKNLRHGCCGKGITEIQAKASALCEALERYSSEFQGTETTIKASYRQLSEKYPGDVIHPNDVMRFSEKQFAERDAWNERSSKFNRVTTPLDDDLSVNWSPVWSLTHSRVKYLPTQLVYFKAPSGDNSGMSYAFGCSNGNASGNNLEEAILQGFFELVERDSTAIWWYNRLRRPGVDLVSCGEPYLLELIKHYESLGRDAWALDITSDLGIATFVAVSRLRTGPNEKILMGFGCHLDPRIALQRSFAEMNQILAIEGGGSAEESRVDDQETCTWLKNATLENQPYVAPDPTHSPRRMEEYPSLHRGDLLTDLESCREIIEKKGLEMLVLNLTRPEIALPTVKVIVPGLRHWWARYAGGRLYDVPVSMGWMRQPLTEEELNPVPIFL